MISEGASNWIIGKKYRQISIFKKKNLKVCWGRGQNSRFWASRDKPEMTFKKLSRASDYLATHSASWSRGTLPAGSRISTPTPEGDRAGSRVG